MMSIIYDPPWMRIGPYLIGIIAAYILMKLKSKLMVKKKIIWLLWILGSSCNLIILFGLTNRNISVLTTAIYNACSRTLWGIGIAWIIIACYTNNGGVINKLLSLKIWIPLSRLSYCAYLLNPFIINSLYVHSETVVHFDLLPAVSMNIFFSKV